MQISQCSAKSYSHSIFLALKILIIDSSMDLEIFPKHIPSFGSASFSFVCTCKCETSKQNQSSTQLQKEPWFPLQTTSSIVKLNAYTGLWTNLGNVQYPEPTHSPLTSSVQPRLYYIKLDTLIIANGTKTNLPYSATVVWPGDEINLRNEIFIYVQKE